mgnify:CR=1 FL=1
MQSPVFAPVQEKRAPVLNIQRSNRAQLLVLWPEEQAAPIIVVFSSPERAKPFIMGKPGYAGGILESFEWVLQNMGSGYGIALNPGTEVGFDIGPRGYKS